MTTLRCPMTECQHNTVVRLRAGAESDNCCRLNDVKFVRDSQFALIFTCCNYEERNEDGK